MGKNFQQQIRVVSRDKLRASTSVIEAAFFDENGDPIELGGGAELPNGGATNHALLYWDTGDSTWKPRSHNLIIGDDFLATLPGFGDGKMLIFQNPSGFQWVDIPS